MIHKTLNKNQTKHVDLVQSEHSHRLIEMQLVLAYLTLNSTIHDEHKYTSKTYVMRHSDSWFVASSKSKLNRSDQFDLQLSLKMTCKQCTGILCHR
jgi:hypothetical protein